MSIPAPLPLLEPLPVRTAPGKPEAQHVEHGRVAPDTNITEAHLPQWKNIETVGLVVRAPKSDFELLPVILDEIRPDEVLIEMRYSGICHTDIVMQQGLLPMVDFPAILGHEGAGFVRAIGGNVRDKKLQVGDAVLLSFNTCGSCKACQSQHPAMCHSHPNVNHNAVRLSDRSTPARLANGTPVRSQYFGQSSFAKMSVVNERCVVRCPNVDNIAIYAPTGCGFQTGAGTVMNVLKPTENDSIVIFGLGSVGLAALAAAKYMGTGKIIAVDVVPEKLELGQELGATETINSKDVEDIATAIKKLTGGGADFAIDCTGLVPVIESMIEAIGPQGTAAIVGVPPPGAQLKLDPLPFLLANKKLVGVIEGDSNPPEFIPQLIKLHEAGKFPIEKLCKTYPVSRFEDAISDLKNGKVIKPVVDWAD